MITSSPWSQVVGALGGGNQSAPSWERTWGAFVEVQTSAVDMMSMYSCKTIGNRSCVLIRGASGEEPVLNKQKPTIPSIIAINYYSFSRKIRSQAPPVSQSHTPGV